MIWLRIAFRNILKHTRRSIFTILAIGVGFAAINLFGGFHSYVFQGLRDTVIYSHAQGHVSVFKKNAQTLEAENDPVKRLIAPDEQALIKKIVSGYPEVIRNTGQLQLSGLLSNGDASTMFIALGIVPSDILWIQQKAAGMIGRLQMFTGKPLRDDALYGIGISAGLAKKLHLTLESDAIVMGPTVDGQINALDAKIVQFIQSPAQELDDKFMHVPLDFAQSLLNTQGVDRIQLLLSDLKDCASIKERLNRFFSNKKLDLVAVTWDENAPFYVKVRNMFRVIFGFLFIIVLIIVVISVVNTMGMTVMERIREIGTIRAMGVRKGGILKLFTMESLLLGCMGCVIGMGLTLLGWAFVKVLEPSWVPPHISMRVPIEVYLVPGYLLATTGSLILLSVAAAIFPANKAARLAVADALGHN
jgi:putative ABC transport system permease protein